MPKRITLFSESITYDAPPPTLPLRAIADRVWAIAKTLRIDQEQAARDLKSVSTELHAIAGGLEKAKA